MATDLVPCFYTTVVNTSGAESVFGFLGKHGRRLAADEQYTVPGNLVDQLAKSARKFAALERAVHTGALALVNTPAVHLADPTLHRTSTLKLDNGTLGVADPCWGVYETVLTAAFTPIADTGAAVATATLTFSAPVTGFSVADLSLTRAATPVTLTGVTVATTNGGRTWTISGLTSLTGTNGAYVIKVTALSSGITDAFGNPLSADASEPWTKS